MLKLCQKLFYCVLTDKQRSLSAINAVLNVVLTTQDGWMCAAESVKDQAVLGLCTQAIDSTDQIQIFLVSAFLSTAAHTQIRAKSCNSVL